MDVKLLFPPELKRKASPPPQKPRNLERRDREYLTPDEIRCLIESARGAGRYAHRDAAIILLAYRHGLRVGELVELRWDQIDWSNQQICVQRLKNGQSSTHPLPPDEMSALEHLHLENPNSTFVFSSERKGPLTRRTVHSIVARAGQLAGFAFSVHPHMLRHARGYRLASKGVDTRTIQAYLGHRNIQYTSIYGPVIQSNLLPRHPEGGIAEEARYCRFLATARNDKDGGSY